MQELDRYNLEKILKECENKEGLFSGVRLGLVDDGLKFIGAGAFSYVYEMESVNDKGESFALKVSGYSRHTVSVEYFEETARIQWILGQESEYVVKMIDAKVIRVTLSEDGEVISAEDYDTEQEECDENSYYIQLILMEKLDVLIEKNRFNYAFLTRKSLYDEENTIKLALQIGSALYSAHSNHVMHRDVKLENIFWDDNRKIYKLGDYGIAKWTAEGGSATVVYTDGYGAPEIERHSFENYGVTADIYSFGIVLYLLLNDLEFPGSDGYYPKAEIQYDPEFVFPAPANASPQMASIIRKMCSYRPEDRYQSVLEVLQDILAKQGNLEDELSEELQSIVDIATVTYHEEKEEVDEDEGEKDVPATRAERKKKRELNDRIYRWVSIKYTAIFTGLIFFALKWYVKDDVMINNTLFLILPAVLMINAVFQSIKDLNITVGVLSLVLIVYSFFSIGVTFPFVLAGFVVVLSNPVLSASSAFGIILWLVASPASWLGFMDIPGECGVGGLVFIGILIAMLEFILWELGCERLNDTYADIGIQIIDKMHIAVIITGIVLCILSGCNMVNLPNGIKAVRIVITGVVMGPVITFFYKKEGLEYYSIWCSFIRMLKGENNG